MSKVSREVEYKYYVESFCCEEFQRAFEDNKITLARIDHNFYMSCCVLKYCPFCANEIIYCK